MKDKLFTIDYLRKHWGNGKRITYKGKKYRVGKMSYGQYFFEPGRPRGERYPLNRGTKWLAMVEGRPDFYKIV